MAEIIQHTGTWTFDGEKLRIVPASGKHMHPLRKALGEVAVPLTALASVAHEPGKKGGRLRLRLREGADPLAQVAGGRLPDASDPYQLAVERDRMGVAEYFVDEVRHALLLDEVPDTPCDRYLLPGPAVPLTANGSDGTASFDGERVQLEWNWLAEDSKSHGGPGVLTLEELAGVEWTPAIGWENGSLRFLPKGRYPVLKPQHDPHCLTLWGVRQARETGGAVLLAAAVVARLPHPLAPPGSPRTDAAAARQGALRKSPGGEPPQETGPEDRADSGHDVLLRRLRELGELHGAGVLTDEEFTAAKKAVLAQF